MIIGLAIAFLAFACTRSETSIGLLARWPGVLSAAALIAAALLVTPSRITWLSLPVAGGAWFCLDRVSAAKVDAVALPLTFLDLHLAAVNPLAVVRAAGLQVSLWPAVVTMAFIAASALAIGSRRRVPLTDRPSSVHRLSGLGIGSRLIALSLSLWLLTASLSAYGRSLHVNVQLLHPDLWEHLWTADAQVRLARRLGVLEYLAFTYWAGDGSTLMLTGGPEEPPYAEIRAASARAVKAAGRGLTVLPNIVVFHAESTFDPGYIFELNPPVQLPLWTAGADTWAIGPLRVNVVGGGSWVTEFEVMTGVDSRTFGYQGFYTHHYIAPLVQSALPRRLHTRGYDTRVYYTADASFFDAERAFTRYGFQRFVSPVEVGLSPPWEGLSDQRFANAVIEHGAFDHSGPFLYLISTTENHGPHPCRNFGSASDLPVRLGPRATFEQECMVNEYLRRAQSTSAAFTAVHNRLRALEQDSGRPYVLLAYGDHQPWSFTDGRYSVAGGAARDPNMPGWSGLRQRDTNITFYHLLASPGLTWPSNIPLSTTLPATLLPTLLSTFVARSGDDIYLPLNLLAFEACGPDAFQPGCRLQPAIGHWWKAALLDGR